MHTGQDTVSQAALAAGVDFRRDVCALIPALRAFARTLAKSGCDADDLVQETLTKAIANAHRFQPGTNLKSWLFTILRNTFYTSFRNAKRESPGSETCASEACSNLPDQEWSLAAGEMRDAIERLPPDQREVLILVGAIGMSYEEAAEICNCPVGTVKSRLNRARNRVLELLSASSPHELFERRASDTGFDGNLIAHH